MKYVMAAFLILFFPVAAYADCTDPDSVAGGMIYNADYQTMQFCDGAQWWSMKGDTMGPIRIAPANNAACNSSMEGGLRYNSTLKVVEFCNGSAWESIILASGTGTPSTPPATAGYFVITNGIWNGNLGGRSGANAKCLTDLQNNDWNGKSDASTRSILSAGHVRAWLCADGTCDDAVANVTYYFAVSGDATKGGASFTANASGGGPGNSQNWSGTNYFDGMKSYWTARFNNNTSTVWGTGNSSGNYASGAYTCGNFTDTDYSSSPYGNSNATDDNRFKAGIASCVSTYHLVCFVDP